MSVQSAIRKGLVACKMITIHDRDVLASEKGNICVQLITNYLPFVSCVKCIVSTHVRYIRVF